MVRFRYYEDILEIYDRYIEDISQDFRNILSILNMISIFSVAVTKFTIFYVHSENIRE